jgi:hypothetical protein
MLEKEETGLITTFGRQETPTKKRESTTQKAHAETDLTPDFVLLATGT